MTHAYSFEIHNYIRDKIATARKNKQKAETENDLETRAFYNGQLKELFEIQEYLVEKVDLKTREQDRKPLRKGG